MADEVGGVGQRGDWRGVDEFPRETKCSAVHHLSWGCCDLLLSAVRIPRRMSGS